MCHYSTTNVVQSVNEATTVVESNTAHGVTITHTHTELSLTAGHRQMCSVGVQ